MAGWHWGHFLGQECSRNTLAEWFARQQHSAGCSRDLLALTPAGKGSSPQAPPVTGGQKGNLFGGEIPGVPAGR